MFKETLDKLSIASHEAIIDGTYNTLDAFKNKSIEWNKSILSSYIEYTGEKETAFVFFHSELGWSENRVFIVINKKFYSI